MLSTYIFMEKGFLKVAKKLHVSQSQRGKVLSAMPSAQMMPDWIRCHAPWEVANNNELEQNSCES